MFKIKKRKAHAVTKSQAQRVVDAYFSREHFTDHDGCCPLLGTAGDVERRGEIVKAAYQEVVEQMVKVFEDNLTCPRPHERARCPVRRRHGAGEERLRFGLG
jgi:TetR/AcrR family transcriptional regulator, transcriptional repressor for nem operon